jgi:heme-degrading monooxygenase HmoA
VYSATFTFIVKEFDEEFHALDKRIAEVARSISGYLGEESWENPATGKISNIYYWDSLDALHKLMQDPTHIIAKQQSAKWLDKYYVTIAQVIKSYGNEEIGFAQWQHQ